MRFLLIIFCFCTITAAFAATVPSVTVTPLKYEVTVAAPIGEVRAALTSVLEARNYAIINVLDVQQGLKARGIKASPIVLIEFCNLVKAYGISRLTPEFELFAPCRFALFANGKSTRVMVLRPAYIAAALPQDKLQPEARATLTQFDSDVKAMLVEVASGGF